MESLQNVLFGVIQYINSLFAINYETIKQLSENLINQIAREVMSVRLLGEEFRSKFDWSGATRLEIECPTVCRNIRVADNGAESTETMWSWLLRAMQRVRIYNRRFSSVASSDSGEKHLRAISVEKYLTTRTAVLNRNQVECEITIKYSETGCAVGKHGRPGCF